MVNALKLLKKKWFTDGKCTKVVEKKGGLLMVNALKLLIKSGLLMVNAQ